MDDTSRITIRETEDGLGIDNPSQSHLPVVLFLCVWLMGWGAGEIFALWALVSGPGLGGGLFLAVWLTFWTIGGAGAMFALFSQLFGVEKLFVTAGAMVRETGFWKFTRRKVFSLADVSDVRAATAPRRTGRRKVAAPGGISFDVNGNTHNFGATMDKAETEAVLEALRRHMLAGKSERQALARTIASIARIKQASAAETPEAGS